MGNSTKEGQLARRSRPVDASAFARRCGDLFDIDRVGKFLQDLDIYRAIYEELEAPPELPLTCHLLKIGREVRHGIRSWTKSDLEDVVRWKRLHRLMPRIQKTPDIENRLESVFRIQDEEERIDALRKIPGVGPVLASAILMFTSPETYGVLDCHAWNALSFLGFDLPTKRPDDGDSFTTSEILGYLRIIRELANESTTTPSKVHKALYALDKARTNETWRQLKWRLEFDVITSLLRLP